MGCSQGSHRATVNPETNVEDISHTENTYVKNDRHCTDVLFLSIMAGFVIVLIGLLAYCMSYADIYRIINGYDDCGNVCGRTNKQQEDLGCSGVDNSNKGFLLVSLPVDLGNSNLVHRSCVESCEGDSTYRKFLNRCLPTSNSKYSFFSKTGLKDFFQEVSEDLETCWMEIIYLCIISLVFSILIMIAMRFFAGFIVWLVLAGILLALMCGTIFLWFQYVDSTSDDDDNATISIERKEVYLVLAILVTIITICVCLVIFALRKRIQLVIQLFKEAGKALATMPLLLVEPILTFIALSFFASLWLYFALFIESAGVATMRNNQSVKYVKDATMMVTRWYNLLALFWFINFTIGCQHMVVAGAVASWFFIRNKAKLASPISKSFYRLVRYHLGTISKGSFFISLVNLVRVMLKWLMYAFREPRNRILECLYCACQCCLAIFERFLQFITRNAYIETAISGEDFCTSAQKSFSLLANNALRVFAINSVGDFILIFAKVFIVLSTILVGIELIQKKEGVYHSWVPLSIGGIFAYFVAHGFISVYEITIDTIFICFCKDCEENDGINTPYYMSRGLMEFVQNSKKLLQQNSIQTGTAWSEEKSAHIA